jgi:hypothetical protein
LPYKQKDAAWWPRLGDCGLVLLSLSGRTKPQRSGQGFVHKKESKKGLIFHRLDMVA